MIKGKQIVVGITGGITAYKAADLVRQFRKRDAAVDVIMTRNAQHFVTPLTFQTISCHPVFTDLFGNYQPEISHIALADKADILIIAPATANIIAKIASGLADDLLSTVALATTAPLLIAPAMNTKMWENPITQDNVKKLKPRSTKKKTRCMIRGTGFMIEQSQSLNSKFKHQMFKTLNSAIRIPKSKM